MKSDMKSDMKSKLPSRSVTAVCMGLLAGVAMLSLAPAAEARVYVGATIFAPVAPPAPRQEYRPVRPGPQAIWVGGHWRWAGRGHVWVPGYWQVPPRRYHDWVPGHWRSGPRGWVWIDGHWR